MWRGLSLQTPPKIGKLRKEKRRGKKKTKVGAEPPPDDGPPRLHGQETERKPEWWPVDREWWPGWKFKDAQHQRLLWGDRGIWREIWQNVNLLVKEWEDQAEKWCGEGVLSLFVSLCPRKAAEKRAQEARKMNTVG